MALKRLLGNELFMPAKNDTVDLDDVLPSDEKLIVGFYIISGNCSQCVEFAKQLINFCDSRSHQEEDKFWVISVCLEEDEEKYKVALQDTPWAALPRTLARHKKARLLRRLRVSAVAPSLVLMEMPSGRVITTSGREQLLEEPQKFPWRAQSVKELLEDVELKGATSDMTVKYRDIKGIKGFYFSANWCPPCKAFTPQLAETYQRLKDRQADFEVIFVSSDRSEASFEAYLNSMPGWLHVPWQEERLRRELAASLGVQGIPCLVLVDQQGAVITDEGRAEVTEDPEAKFFPWPERRVNLLNERTAVKLQDGAALVLLVETEEDLDEARSSLQPAASELWASRGREQDDLGEEQLSFFVGCDSDTSDALREFAGLDDVVPLLVLLDVGQERVSTMDVENITPGAVQNFVKDFLAGQLTWNEIPPPPAPTECPPGPPVPAGCDASNNSRHFASAAHC